MAKDPSTAREFADRVRVALEAADLTAFRDLLDPDARWGPPDDPLSGCHNRDQVLAWYTRARDEGMRARVTEVVVAGGDKLLIGLKVTGTPAAAEQGGEADRWQVMTLGRSGMVDIRGFDDRDAALTRRLPGSASDSGPLGGRPICAPFHGDLGGHP
ncbi:MAG: nuclear transport factor 2 family protein [Acidimicrobiales bacterium]